MICVRCVKLLEQGIAFTELQVVDFAILETLSVSLQSLRNRIFIRFWFNQLQMDVLCINSRRMELELNLPGLHAYVVLEFQSDCCTLYSIKGRCAGVDRLSPSLCNLTANRHTVHNLQFWWSTAVQYETSFAARARLILIVKKEKMCLIKDNVRFNFSLAALHFWPVFNEEFRPSHRY